MNKSQLWVVCAASSLPIIYRFEQSIQVLSFVKTTIEKVELKDKNDKIRYLVESDDSLLTMPLCYTLDGEWSWSMKS